MKEQTPKEMCWKGTWVLFEVSQEVGYGLGSGTETKLSSQGNGQD